MTTYGTIPSQANPSSNQSVLRRAKGLILLALSSRRPWIELVQFSAFSLPTSLSVATERIKTNMVIFRTNYAVIFVVTIVISLLWHPIHLSIFVVLIMAWLYVYSRDNEPLLIFGNVMDDSTLVLVLLVLTICVFLLTDLFRSVVIAAMAGFPVILLHGTCRNTEALFVLEDDDDDEKMTTTISSSS